MDVYFEKTMNKELRDTANMYCNIIYCMLYKKWSDDLYELNPNSPERLGIILKTVIRNNFRVP